MSAPEFPAVHAVVRLRAERLARALKPFVARGSKSERCPHCRVPVSHCLCDWRVQVPTPTRAGVCLLMADIEPLKPTNTGWLIADVVPDTFAFGWARTEVDPALLALLADPQWQPYVVFPGEYAAPERVVTQVATPASSKRPLYVLLDATWSEARKMFRKSPYLNTLPVLSLQGEQISRYRLRRSKRDDHFCTAEVAALCLELGGDAQTAAVLDAYFDVFSQHYLLARRLVPLAPGDDVHQRLAAVLQPSPA
ncbi:tRNA-uridine aminocarboxypropyltransferase [Curvibacter sp. APW13]|uniref:tRNA-uridine aminocarboxypropyltransferase n=1 Tax=Curvibacter sp. APW13 TaxID=3077236 RepID=UPI0028DD6119|nr:tRNA-uridine aminocarboxypropyltransferase [Curvibacter sp. APW13]MDT8990463.1 tRNA-uridine aminocarboxypropyltransferase [Curvibacter sp. APW13]